MFLSAEFHFGIPSTKIGFATFRFYDYSGCSIKSFIGVNTSFVNLFQIKNGGSGFGLGMSSIRISTYLNQLSSLIITN
jgi:hypothetical protein